MQSTTRLESGSKKANVRLWIVQGLLALLFLFAGGMKLTMPVEALAQQSQLPGAFMQFIGVCEVCGALGLILPGLFRIRTELTPLAAAGLVIIMIGATVVTLLQGQSAPALVPVVVGSLASYVVRGRLPRRVHEPVPQTTHQPVQRRAA
jgi:uncharacterized membrane protein YphA (DoxX/SURF4 family)